jgi:hypothetical protein
MRNLNAAATHWAQSPMNCAPVAVGQKSDRRGRRTTQDNVHQADQHEVVLPAGFDLSECNPVRKRPVWRIRDGKSKRSSGDKRRGDAGRSKRVSELFDELCDLCVALCGLNANRSGFRKTETDRKFDNLTYEIVRLSCDDELFTFVRYSEASGTNNEAERSIRGAAEDRRTCHTGKTLRGAQRRTILISVLESLKLHLLEFTLASVQSEMQSWRDNGENLFSRIGYGNIKPSAR